MSQRIEQAFAPSPDGARHHNAFALIGPATFVLLLLVLATASDGAFAIRQWAPPAIFLVALLAALIGAGGGAPLPRPWGPVALAGWWAFAGWSLLSVTWAASPGDALIGGLRDVLYAAVVTLPLVAVFDRRALKLAGYGVVAGICVLAVGTAGVMLADGPSVFLAGRLDAPIGYRNATALLFGVAYWPLLCVAATRDAGRGLRALALALATLCVSLAFLTQSRGVVLGFAAGGVIALVLLPPDRVRRAWLTILVLLLVAVGSGALLQPYDAFDGGRGIVTASDIATAAHGLLLLVVGAFLLGLAIAVFDNGLRATAPEMAQVRIGARVALIVVVVIGLAGGLAKVGNPVGALHDRWDEFKANETIATGSTRLTNAGGQRYDLWRIALNEFQDQPLHGTGRDNYAYGYYRERATDRNLDTAHSLVFEVLGELGAVGLTLLLIALVGLAAVILGNWRHAPPDVRRQAAGLAAAGGVLVGQSMVDWIWRIPGLTALGLLALSCAAAMVTREAVPATRSRSLATPLRVAGAAALALAAVAVASSYVGDHYIRSARAEQTPDKRLRQAERAARFSPLAVTPLYLQASALESMGDRAGAERKLQQAHDREPLNAATLGLLGDIRARAGDFTAAAVYYRRALALNPKDVGLQQLAQSGGRPTR